MHRSRLNLSLVLLALLALTACKKEYTCTCSFSYQANGQTVYDTGTYIDEYRTKSNAIQYCDEHEESYLNTGASSVDCVSSVN